MTAALKVVEHLESFTYRWSTESELQTAIWDVLHPRFPGAQREVHLSPQDRPDFMVGVDDVTVAIEVKVKGSRASVLRQLGRYAAHDEVDAVVLASGRRVLAASMPPVIHDKPVLAAFLGAAL
jgi:hypothetical protein